MLLKNQIISLLTQLNKNLQYNIQNPDSKQESTTKLIDDLQKCYFQIKTVVIVRLDAIGDSLLFVNSVKQIRQLFPNATITFVCFSETEEIISRSPYIDIPVFIDRHNLESNKNYRELIYTKLNKYSFDVLINPLYSREFLSEEIIYFINAALKIGYKGDVSNISPALLDVTNKWYDVLLETEPIANIFELHRNAELVNLLGGNSNPKNLPELFFRNEDLEFIDNILLNYGIEKYAVVFPGTKGGKNSIKYWGAENFAAIIDYIQSNLKLKVLILGGADEQQICEEIVTLSKTEPLLFQGHFSLWKAVEVLKRAEFYLGSDTSIAHFAAALKIQTLVLLGGGHFKRFFPYPDHNHVKVIYKKLACYNCNWKCTQETNKCIKEISVKDVKQLINSLEINLISNTKHDVKAKNLNLVISSGSKPRIDLLLPPGNLHSWHLKEAWLLNLKSQGLLNKVFYTDSNNYQHFFNYIKKGTNSDLILALGGDHHLYYLHDTQQKIDIWNKYQNKKVCYSYESTLDAQYDFYKTRAESASKVFSHFLVADEIDVNFFKLKSNKAIWFPQFVDEKFFMNYTAFTERKNNLFFRGKLWNEYKVRQKIVESLNEVKLLEIVDKYLSNSELVSCYNRYKAVLNPPGVFGGFNVRTFESLATGNILFQFLPAKRPLNNGLFEHLTHIIYFDANDTSSIKNQIRNILSEIETYKSIADNGYNEVLNYHTLDKRLSSLLDWVDIDKIPDYPNYGLPKLKEIKNQIPIKVKENVKAPEIKLSAIVSVYDSEKFIEGCLNDLIEQTLFKKDQLEIIIVNTGSRQNEETIIEKYKRLHKNIKYIKTENRETIYSAWNRGIKAASGKYITNANTDDRHKSDALEILCKLLDDNIEIDVVYADQFKTTIANSTWENLNHNEQIKWAAFDKDLLLFGCFIGPQPVWKKSLHDKYGLFNQQLKVVGDYEFWLRISKDAKFYHLPEVLGIYYYSPESVEHRDNKLTETENKMIQKFYIAQNISSINAIEELKAKLKIIDSSKVSPKYLNDAYQMLDKRASGIILEKDISNFILHLKDFNEINIIEKAKEYLLRIESSSIIMKKENYQESLYTILGFYYLEGNDLQNARIHFENILTINNTSSIACEGLGTIFLRSGELNGAKTMLEWAVKNNPQNQNAIKALKTVNIALSFPENHNSLLESEIPQVEYES